MADISKIKTLDGTIYDLKDSRTKYKVSLTAEVTIPANSDLNSTTYLKTGSYANPLSANTTTISNIPDGLTEAFMLNVYSPLSGNSTADVTSGNWIYRLQELTVYRGISRWVRLCSTNGEGTWIFANWTKLYPKTYTANTSKLVTTTVPNVTSVGSAPTLGTEIAADDITAWTTNTPTSFSVSGETLTITSGTAASLSYTARSIPNVTSVGSAPTLGTAVTVATGSLASNGSGGTVATGITAS